MDFEEFRPEWVVEYYDKPQPVKAVARKYRRRYGLFDRWHNDKDYPQGKPRWITYSLQVSLLEALPRARKHADEMKPPLAFRVRNIRTNEVIPIEAFTN